MGAVKRFLMEQTMDDMRMPKGKKISLTWYSGRTYKVKVRMGR